MQRKARIRPFALLGVALSCALVEGCIRSHGAVVRLVQTIPLPGVEGRIDHFSVDLAGKRLFVCALGNNSVEVIDLEKGERAHSVAGLGSPQGVAYVPESNRLYVANDKGGLCNIYDGSSFAKLGEIDLKDDADNIRYDPASKRIYVGHGNGGLATIESDTGKNVGSVPLAAHPEAFVLERRGSRIFVNVPSAAHVAVIDRREGKVVATWKTDGGAANFPMALDEANHRLFIGCRSPAKLVVLNTETGDVVATLAISGDVDDLFYDETRRRIYAVCGAGSIALIAERDPDIYSVTGQTATAAGARTGLFVPELNSLFVAIPRSFNREAEVRSFAVD